MLSHIFLSLYMLHSLAFRFILRLFLSCTHASLVAAMASHVRSSLQQVIDTLMWVQTTDEEQLAVAFSRMPVHERRAFLARAQDAVFNSHSHATGSAAVEATYLDSPAFRQEPPLHSTSRSWADMSEGQTGTSPPTLHSGQQQQEPADPVQEHNQAREANAGQETRLGHCNVQRLALIGCREHCSTCGVSQCGYSSENPLDSHFRRSDTVHSCKDCHKRKKEQARAKPAGSDDAGQGGWGSESWGSDTWGSGWDHGWQGSWSQWPAW